MSKGSDHISETDTVSETQLGVNHLVIRNRFMAWLQVVKNLGRAYKKQTRSKHFRPLLLALCRELFETYFHEVFLVRGEASSLVTDDVIDADVAKFLPGLIGTLQKRLAPYVIQTEADKRKFTRVVRSAMLFINYVVVVRPLGDFFFSSIGEQFDSSLHQVKNPRGEGEFDELVESGRIDEETLWITEIVHAGYRCQNAIFVRAGVVVSRDPPSLRKRSPSNVLNLTTIDPREFEQRFSARGQGELLLEAFKMHPTQLQAPSHARGFNMEPAAAAENWHRLTAVVLPRVGAESSGAESPQEPAAARTPAKPAAPPVTEHYESLIRKSKEMALDLARLREDVARLRMQTQVDQKVKEELTTKIVENSVELENARVANLKAKSEILRLRKKVASLEGDEFEGESDESD